LQIHVVQEGHDLKPAYGEDKLDETKARGIEMLKLKKIHVLEESITEYLHG